MVKFSEEQIDVLKYIIFGRIDWPSVFVTAYNNRKTSWYELGHIKEWRNATDEILYAVWHQLEYELDKINKETK